MTLAAAQILEIGAGSGALAAELLLELERRSSLPERYQILELSGELRARQQHPLAAPVPHLPRMGRVWGHEHAVSNRIHTSDASPLTLAGVTPLFRPRRAPAALSTQRQLDGRCHLRGVLLCLGHQSGGGDRGHRALFPPATHVPAFAAS